MSKKSDKKLSTPQKKREALGLPENICAAPFTQLFLYPDGNVFSCCENGFVLGNIKENTLEEIWNGERAKQLRTEFVDNKIEICKNCIKHKGCNTHYDNLLEDVQFTPEASEHIYSFDLIINGQCNLRCEMCEVWQQDNQTYDGTSFWTQGEEKYFSKLKSVSVKSGEPFIQKDTFKLIDSISKVNKDCKWTFTTNGHFNFNKAIEKYLDKIEIEDFIISIDSLSPEVFAKIRLDGDLKKCIKTLENISAYRNKRAAKESSLERRFNITLQMAVQQSNGYELPNYMHFARSKGLNSNLLFVHEPEELSLTSLKDEEKIKILDFYFTWLKRDILFLGKLRPIIVPIIDSLPIKIKAEKKLSFIELQLLYKENVDKVTHSNSSEDQICPLPFTQLYLAPHGEARPCCWLDDYVVGDIKENTISEIWNNDKMQALREEFLTGNIKTCKDKIKHWNCNNNRKYLFSQINLESDQHQNIKRLDVMINGGCNLDCIMCLVDRTNGLYREEKIWEDMKKNIFPYLYEVDFQGGEPFIFEDTFDFIDEVHKVNPDCNWIFTTNGHYPFNKRIKDTLRKINIRTISISIDSLVPEIFEKIRKNGKLETVLDFMDEMLEFTKHRSIEICCNMTILKDNYGEIEEFIKYAREKNINLFFLVAQDPRELSILDFDNKKVQRILENIKYLHETYNEPSLIELMITLENHLLK